MAIPKAITYDERLNIKRDAQLKAVFFIFGHSSYVMALGSVKSGAAARIL